MIDIFGNENPSIIVDGIELKPCRRYDKILPGYYVSQCAKIFSTKTNKFLQPNYRNKNSKDPNKAKIFRITIYVPIGFFDDYAHFAEEGKNVCQLTCDLHKLVIDSWKPLDDYTHEIDPPISKEEWSVLPPNVKTIIKESLVVDHIESNDGTIECNHLSNLRRTTSTRNERSRKAAAFETQVEFVPVKIGDSVWNSITQEYEVDISFNGEEGKEIYGMLEEISEVKGMSVEDTFTKIIVDDYVKEYGTEGLAQLN